MKAIELFILEKKVNISQMEIDLGLPEKSLKIKQRGIPKKHEDAIVRYLVENFGYSGDVPLEEEVDIPNNIVPKKKKMWNEGFVPKYKDSIVRYQDVENGLWKRLLQWGSKLVDKKDENGDVVKDKDGKPVKVRKIRDEFLPITGEVLKDKIGEYYIAKNGIKVYSFRGNFSKVE